MIPKFHSISVPPVMLLQLDVKRYENFHRIVCDSKKKMFVDSRVDKQVVVHPYGGRYSMQQ